MFILQDMVIELVVVAVVFAVVLLSVVVLATVSRDWLERRRAHTPRARLRRSVWRDYAAACAPPIETQTSAVPVVAEALADTGACTVCDPNPYLSAGPAGA